MPNQSKDPLQQGQQDVIKFFTETLSSAASEAAKMQEFYTLPDAEKMAQQIAKSMLAGIVDRATLGILETASFKTSSKEKLNEIKSVVHESAVQTMMTHYADSYAALTGGNSK